MKDEARDILRAALLTESARSISLVAAIRTRMSALGGVELEFPPREAIRHPPELDN
ncbi:MAG: hypothetical protein LBB76_08340 [Azoarcus sp.]|jgi:plasmid stability protein|nr:hypothetical protein [Azoarcus sp.]